VDATGWPAPPSRPDATGWPAPPSRPVATGWLAPPSRPVGHPSHPVATAPQGIYGDIRGDIRGYTGEYTGEFTGYTGDIQDIRLKDTDIRGDMDTSGHTWVYGM